ncbi:LuxR C-terminal-related transcriptional regulator [Agreia bicolorata]|uniref:LuxR C-terminal-related transcriptional regulator n=1 Tax=Agreia bicolorata TaxID=110935 RepID=UPI001FD2DF90|nr:LuxR C-terminal-related transcriptional regulator [Agreia bicolorata]
MSQTSDHRYVAYKSELLTFAESFDENREAEIARASAIVLSGGSVIIAAAAGMGKSRAARACATAARARGRTVETVTCVRLRDEQLIAQMDAHPGLLIVEDAHLLGLDDTVRLADLASAQDHSVLITLDTGVSYTAARTEESLRELTNLWTERGIPRVDLGGVGYDEAVRIVETIAGPNRIDIVTRARIMLLAEGNPRLLEELTREELQRGTYSARQQNMLLGPSYMSPRVVDFVRPLLRRLSAEEEYALVTLARLGLTPFARAASLVGSTALRSLLRRGLVRYDQRTPDCVFSRSLYARAALAIQIGENPLEARHVVELALLHDASIGVELSGAECAFAAEYLLNDPSHDPLDDMSSSQVAVLLARAARHANDNGMPGSARMLAHRSLSYEPTLTGVEQLSRCLVKLGKFQEAIDVLERVHVPHTDPKEDALYIAWWIQLLGQHGPSSERLDRLQEEARSWGTVDSALDEWASFARARSRMMLSCYADGVEEMEGIAESGASSSPFVLRAITELMPCYVYRGETSKFERVLRTGWAMVAPALSASASSGVKRSDRSGVITEFVMQASLVRGAVGHDRAGLARELESFALRTVESADEYGMALVNLAAGHLALEKGQAERAENELQRALERVGYSTQMKWTTWMQILRSNALAVLHRYDDALLMEREISAITRESTPWLAHYSSHLSARMKAYDGDLAGSAAACRAIADAGSDSRFFAVRPLHVAAALGDDPEELVLAIEQLPSQQMWDSTRLLESHLRASADGDADELERIGAELAALEFWWEAVFSFTTAATIHGDSANESRRNAALAQAEAIRRHVPSLQLVDDNASPEHDAMGGEADELAARRLAKLTPRELEVVTLAADGLTNAEIASHLYLSVRTVESHVLQARSKLGAIPRSELRSIVRG